MRKNVSRVALLLCVSVCCLTFVSSQRVPTSFILNNAVRFEDGGQDRGQGQLCMIQCPDGFVPGTCLCHNQFPFMFPATPCRFTKCRQGFVCRMENGRAKCVAIAREAPAINACNLPAATGPCKARITRFFFDPSDATCRTFTYGGCQGNGNSFRSGQECEQACIATLPKANTGQGMQGQEKLPENNKYRPQVCNLPKDPGFCFAAFPKYYFNAQSGSCEPFTYGGCPGNGNRFSSFEECQKTCGGNATPPDNSGSGFPWMTPAQPQRKEVQSRDPECNLARAVGRCRGYMPSYFYSTASGKCERFVYGGCGGNANRFVTEMQCRQRCMSPQRDLPSVPSVLPSRPRQNAACAQPKKVRFCRAAFRRWYFDQVSASCKIFTYGRCGANDNNFMSREACEQRCGLPTSGSGQASSLPAVQPGRDLGPAPGGSGSSPSGFAPSGSSPSRPAFCATPTTTGMCKAYMPSWTYSPDKDACTEFIYGGCGANQNHYSTLQDCQAACQPGNAEVRMPGIREPELLIPSVNAFPPGWQRELPAFSGFSGVRANSNANTFSKVLETPSRSPSPSRSDLPAACSQPRVVGRCRALKRRFFYDVTSGDCKTFNYGGCGGNANNFQSHEACARRCLN